MKRHYSKDFKLKLVEKAMTLKVEEGLSYLQFARDNNISPSTLSTWMGRYADGKLGAHKIKNQVVESLPLDLINEVVEDQNQQKNGEALTVAIIDFLKGILPDDTPIDDFFEKCEQVRRILE